MFAIAFALHAALRHDLETILFTQSEMRSHLIKCFHHKYLEPFPHKKVESIPEDDHWLCVVCFHGYTLLCCYFCFSVADGDKIESWTKILFTVSRSGDWSKMNDSLQPLRRWF